MSGRSSLRFVPSLESLDERVNLSPVTAPLAADSIWIDLTPPVQAADAPARFFNGVVSRVSAGGANETITIGGARTEAPAQPSILLRRLANPSLPDAGNPTDVSSTNGGAQAGADSFHGTGIYRSTDAGRSW